MKYLKAIWELSSSNANETRKSRSILHFTLVASSFGLLSLLWQFSRLASSNERPEVERPNMDASGPVHDGEVVADGSFFVETARFQVCPREGQYGIQVPLDAWHSVVVHEPSTILEAKNGAYKP